MSLKVGIVGLPNVGKSTLFNALLKKQQAYVANFPFATIDPNIGVVPVPDPRLDKLAEVIKESEGMGSLPPKVPATVEFVDIAGLIAGAHKGEGLGNKFLSHIREVDAICHVVRHFEDGDIVKTGTNPKEDLEVIETELALSDIETLEKQREPRMNATKEEKYRWDAVLKIKEKLSQGTAAREVQLTEDEELQAKQLNLLTNKPILVVLNVDENALKQADQIEKDYADQANLQKDQVIAICAKTEAELAALDEEEQKMYLSDLGVEESGLERLAQKAFKTLGLITFLTAGEKEVRAWTIKDGFTAVQASGAIHTDFMAKFIKAEIAKFQDFVELGGLKAARTAGKARLEGKEYIMQDGDVVEFKIGS
jgi:ribosome-binding ATPase